MLRGYRRMKEYDVIVIGAGAAGLFCAAQLGQAGQSVLVLDNGKKIGRKILMSGGGFCNFTNLEISADRYISQNPHFVKSALARYTQWDFIALVAQYQIAYHEKELGQLFCDESAQQIVNLLQTECDKGKVEILLKQAVISLEKNAKHYQIQTANQHFSSKNVVVATGGLSMPALGATPFGYKIAEQFGIPIIPPRASLVPFTWRETDRHFAQLSGISLPICVKNQSGDKHFTNQLLFTHRGISGPAILQISNYWQAGEYLEIDFLPSDDISSILSALRQSSPKLQLKTVLTRHLPKKLVELWVEHHYFSDKAIAQLTKNELTLLSEFIHHWHFLPNGTEGYRTAEVTMGGIDTDYISSKTMEAKTSAGLYFIGEVLDVTGWLGGFNFQWAWSSAFACAESIVAKDQRGSF